MEVPTRVRPRRRHVFPFFVAVVPMLWFVFRETPVRVVDGQRVATPLVRTIALAIGAVVVSYVIAVVVVAAIDPLDARSGWGRVLFRPSDRALVALAVLSTALVTYTGLHAIVTLPPWSELLVGLSLLWPLLVATYLTVAVGNAVPALQSFALQAGVAAVGLGLSAAWLFLLATGIARVLSRAE